MKKRIDLTPGPSQIQINIWIDEAKAFAERRSPTDPTREIPEPYRSDIRAIAQQHLRRIEQNRVAETNAARYTYRSSPDGEIMEEPSGLEEQFAEPDEILWG